MLQLNDTVKLGIFASSDGVPVPIEWQVYKLHDNLAQLIVKDISLVQHSYSTIPRPYYGSEGMSDVRWKDSELRKWLNGDFFESSFSSAEKQCIVESIINDNQEWEVDRRLGDDEDLLSFSGRINHISTTTTRDRVFLPKLEEIANYKSYNDTFLSIVKKWSEKRFRWFTVLNICKIRFQDWNYRTRSYVYTEGHEHGSHVGICYYSSSPEYVGVDLDLWAYNNPTNVCIPVMIWVDMNKLPVR